MKQVLVSNGNNDFRGTTKATTEKGYIRAAKQIWPYSGGVQRVKVKVYDPEIDASGQDPIIFSQMIDIIV